MQVSQPRANKLLWTAAIFAIVWAGFGSQMLHRWAYAVERGRIQASSEELAELEAQLPEVTAVSRAFKLVTKIARPGVVHIRVEAGRPSDDADADLDPRVREMVEEMLDSEEYSELTPEERIEKRKELIEQYRRWISRMAPPPGSGSGIVIDGDGHILTNNHVVGQRGAIRVVLHDEREFPATIVGTDPKTDLAVIKIDAPDLHPLKLGDSDRLDVGDWVIAVGSPFGLQQTVTHGIVSAKGRSSIVGVDIDYQDFIQTDAAINPGNSGGPLLNLRGEVVGVNTAIATHGDGVNAGIAFTIPSNMARKVTAELKAHGEVRRGYLGIVPTPTSPSDVEILGLPGPGGVMVDQVLRRSPADRAGLRVEDVIVRINDEAVAGYQQFRAVVADLRPHAHARLTVIRDTEEVALRVRMGLQPESLRIRTEPTIDSLELPRLGLKVRTFRSGLLRQYTLPYDGTERGVIVFGHTSEKRRADVKIRELIVECNGRPVTSVHDLRTLLADAPRDRDVTLKILEPTGDARLVPLKSPRSRR